MVEKIVTLVESLPDYRHGMYVPHTDICNAMRDLGYFVEQKDRASKSLYSRSRAIGEAKYSYHWMYVSKTESYKDNINYGTILLKQDDYGLITLIYENEKFTSIQNSISVSKCLMDAFIGYDESCKTLPEIWSKIIMAFCGDIPVTVKYIYHKEVSVKMSTKLDRLN